jgi:hypothetical protein
MRYTLAACGVVVAGLTALPDPAEAGWKKVCQDTGKKGDVADYWHAWGTPANEATGTAGYTISRGPEGMRVTSGPDPLNDAHRVMLWALCEIGTADVRVAYNYTRHDKTGPVNPVKPTQTIGISSMLLLSADGTGGTVPVDPTTVTLAAPSLNLLNTQLDGVRLTYSTDYNPDPGLVGQLRGNLVPGNIGLQPPSPLNFPFTAGIKYHLLWEKVGDQITVEVTAEGGTPLTHVFRNPPGSPPGPTIASKDGRRIGLYQQPYRDATYSNFMVWQANPD